MRHFQTHFSAWYLDHFQWNDITYNALTVPWDTCLISPGLPGFLRGQWFNWLISGYTIWHHNLGNGLLPDGTQTLPEPMLILSSLRSWGFRMRVIYGKCSRLSLEFEKRRYDIAVTSSRVQWVKCTSGAPRLTYSSIINVSMCKKICGIMCLHLKVKIPAYAKLRLDIFFLLKLPSKCLKVQVLWLLIFK